jgi:isoamylase
MLNAGTNACDFRPPPAPSGTRWHVAVDTFLKTPGDSFAVGEEPPLAETRTYHVNSRSSVMLLARPTTWKEAP